MEDANAIPQASTRDPESVRIIAEKCQQLVEDAVCGAITSKAFLEKIREAGASPREANDYVEQVTE
jgi:hypothetical protein